MVAISLTPRVRQVLIDLSVGMLLMGIVGTWVSASVEFQEMWHFSMTFLISIPGSLLGGFLYEYFGPRRVMLILSIIVSCCLIATPLVNLRIIWSADTSRVLLLILRAIQAGAVAVFMPCIAVYIYEISDKHIRGTMASTIVIIESTGTLLGFITSNFLSPSTMALILPVVTFVLGSLGILFSPESPLWMARKGKHTEAETTMKLVRCTPEEVASDLQVAQANSPSQDAKCFGSLTKFKEKKNILGMIASCLIMIISRVGMSDIIVYHISSILIQPGLDQIGSLVIIMIAQLVCSILGTVLIHYLSRRFILTLGNTLMGLSAIALATFFYMQNNNVDENGSAVAWFPLTGFVTCLIGYAVCVGPCSWTMAIEVLPEPVRSVGFSVAFACYLIIGLIRLNFGMNWLVEYGEFWMFSANAICYILIVFLFLPETKGLSLQEIGDYWKDAFKKERNAAPV